MQSEIPHLEQIQSVAGPLDTCVYLEGLAAKVTADGLQDYFSKLSGGPVQIHRICPREHAPYSFCLLQFACAQTAARVLEMLPSPLRPDVSNLEAQCTKRAPLPPDAPAWLNASSALPALRWEEQTLAYANLLAQTQETVSMARAARISQHKFAKFQDACVVSIQNLHPGTNSRVVHRMLSLYAPDEVCYIDYQRGKSWAYARFKAPRAAQLAAFYLSRGRLEHRDANEYIPQPVRPDDAGERAALDVRVLEGREQREYWDTIKTRRKEKRTREKSGKRCHGDDAVQPACKVQKVEEKSSVHVRFSDSDS
ncbi:MAG: hypothetical protein SGCHY_002972 [Lobulomycetales sp.]